MLKKLLVLLTLHSAQAVPLVNGISGSVSVAGNDQTTGWAFSTSNTLTIDSIGFYDYQADGLNVAHQVGIWNASGVLLASALVDNASILSDGFRYTTLPSLLTLLPGTYVLGAFLPTNVLDGVLRQATYTTIPGVTFLEARIIGGPSLDYPSAPFISVNPGFFSVNLNVVSVSYVPELDPTRGAAPLLLAGTLFALLAGRRSGRLAPK